MASTDGVPQASPSFSDIWRSLVSSFAQNASDRLKAWSPQLVPLIICVAALPVLLLFSFIAGWIVWSSVPQGWYVPVFLQYGDAPAPYADLEVAPLSTTQPYEISLHITVPATDANYHLGNFMASLKVTTFSNVTVVNVRKPALIVPPLPGILPLSRPARLLDLTVPLASSLVTGVSRVKAHVELGRKDGWKTLGHGEGREISVYAASLHGVVSPQGLRRVVASAPLTFAFAAALVFFAVSTLVLAGCLLPSMVQTEPIKTEETVKTEEIDRPPLEGATSVTRMRRRSSRVKEESDGEESAISPLAQTVSESEGRRRLRRSLSHDNE